MIVKMKKLTLLCLADHRIETVNLLAELGAVQVINGKLTESGDRQVINAELIKAERVIAAISDMKPPAHVTQFAAPGKILLNELDAKLVTYDAINKEIDQLIRQNEILLPWGDFSPKTISNLERGGIKIALCTLPGEEFAKFIVPDEVTVQVVSSDKTMVRFICATAGELPENLPLANLPEKMSLSEIAMRLNTLKAERNELSKKLAEAHGALPKLKKLQSKLQNEYSFLACRDGMGEFGEIAVVSGFIPVTECDNLLAAARKNGWGIQLEDPSEEDLPPVLLDMPKWLEPIRPLIEFLGILPGYREIDVSLSMLIFMTIFFSLLVNDAGYGALFLTASIIGIIKFKKSPKGRQVAALCTIFSVATIIWGILAGSWFGVEYGGLKFLTEENKNSNIQFICFSLAVIQLSIGHICQIFKHPNFRNIMGQFGWIMVLFGFYIVAIKIVAYPGNMPEAVTYLVGGGTAMLLIFKVEWRNIGSIFNFPFEIINCFTDMLSYIRLFAVGMAGGYMASCFNSMAVGMMESAWWAIPFGVIIILTAHALNIGLGLIAVLVHGVRLNTLEFSSHTGLTWSGTEYKPLKKN